MTTIEIGTRKGRHSAVRRGLVGAATILALAQLFAESPALQALRAPDGTVACLVNTTADSPQGQSQLAVQVRLPATPGSQALATLPPELRDFSSLPVRVVLLSTPIGGAVPLQRLPASFSALVEHPLIDATPSVDGFVRAIFPRAWLTAGATILGERMAVGPDGTRVTSQTRCAITEADAAQWR